MKKKSKLVTDDDGHWYIVPVDDILYFNQLNDQEESTISDSDYGWLESLRVAGPWVVTFDWEY